MKVYALVGKAGTGKSYRAVSLAYEKKISAIIDDGLFILGSRKLEGSSAKKESNKISAVKRALFFDEDHKRSVIDRIQKEKPESILIIGTSERMVHTIGKSLELPAIDEIFMIEDVSTPEDIEKAKEQRILYGKHVIPLPTVELKRDFSGYFLDAVKAVSRLLDYDLEIGEKTVMRPSFSYMGKYTIANKTLHQIADASTRLIAGFGKITRMKVRKNSEGLDLEIDITIHLGAKIHEVASMAQSQIKSSVEHMTGLHITSINIHVRNLILNSE